MYQRVESGVRIMCLWKRRWLHKVRSRSHFKFACLSHTILTLMNSVSILSISTTPNSCPTGGLCPGGYRVWPRPGYFSSSEFSAIAACPPPDATERCRGWDPAISATICGPTYLQGSFLCQACAVGSYSVGDGTCRLCPSVKGSSFLLSELCFFAAFAVAQSF